MQGETLLVHARGDAGGFLGLPVALDLRFWEGVGFGFLGVDDIFDYFFCCVRRWRRRGAAKLCFAVGEGLRFGGRRGLGFLLRRGRGRVVVDGFGGGGGFGYCVDDVGEGGFGERFFAGGGRGGGGFGDFILGAEGEGTLGLSAAGGGGLAGAFWRHDDDDDDDDDAGSDVWTGCVEFMQW